MISPLIPMVGLTVIIGFMAVTPRSTEDASLQISIADNITFFHDSAVRSGFALTAGGSNPFLSENAISIPAAGMGAFTDMGNWTSVGFLNGSTTYFLTYSSGISLKYPNEAYDRALSIAKTNLPASNSNTAVGPLTAEVGGNFSVGDVIFEISGASITPGSAAIVTFYEDL